MSGGGVFHVRKPEVCRAFPAARRRIFFSTAAATRCGARGFAGVRHADPRGRQARRSSGASGTVNTETTMQRPGIALARGVGSFQRRRPAADVVPDVPPSRRRPLSSRPRGLTGALFRASRSASASAVVSLAYPRAFRGFCMLNQNRNALFHAANEGTVSSFGAPGGRALPFRSSSLLASS